MQYGVYQGGDASRGIASRANYAAFWLMEHPGKAGALMAALIAAACVIAAVSAPREADAFGLLGILVTLGPGLLEGIGIDTPEAAIEDWLRTCCNYLINIINNLLAGIVSPDTLTKEFSNLFSGCYDVVYGIHNGIVITCANVVLCTFLIVGLVKVLQRAGAHDTGIDPWQLLLPFILFVFAKAVVDSSWELMIMVYDMVLELIRGIIDAGVSPTGGLVPEIGEDVKSIGALVTIEMGMVFVMLAVALVTLIAHGVIIVRNVQIYVYTALAPIPLAFFLAESSRPMATGFLKRWLATLLAGAIMALLLVMMAGIIGSGTVIAAGVTEVTTPNDVVQLICDLTWSLVSVIAFAWCMLKSGGWARELVGV